jgi:RHH-type proline utilization regulon transcriptional repressor/proline dehydrogenase/delta 1-pyrroline-5-carboxylate dehydrogenase
MRPPRKPGAKDLGDVRIYAPVGSHEDLLPYLVRRLLENGANTSFVHAFLDDACLPKTSPPAPSPRRATLDRHPFIPARLRFMAKDRV